MAVLHVDEAVERTGPGRFQVAVIAVLALLEGSDGSEVLLIAVLGPLLRCQWALTSVGAALLTTSVFLGMAAGGLVWGPLSDRLGRRPVVLVAGAATFYFALGSAASPSLGWLCTLRGLMAFFGGGVFSVVSVHAMELMPRAHRARAEMLLLLSWSVGGLLVVGLAWLLARLRLGWRWLVGLSSAPFLAGLLLAAILVPPSPRFLLARGRHAEAKRVLDAIARINGRPPLDCDLRRERPEGRAGPLQLVGPELRATSAWLGLGWLISGAGYVGATLVATELAAGGGDGCPCGHLAFSTLAVAQLGGLAEWAVNSALLDPIGRRRTAAANAALGAAAFLLLIARFPGRWAIARDAILFVANFAAGGFHDALYVYTCEAYPTTARSTALGVFTATARIGAMASPLVAQVLFEAGHRTLTLAIYAGGFLLGALAALMLPVETAGRAMPQTVAEAAPRARAEADPGRSYSTFTTDR